MIDEQEIVRIEGLWKSFQPGASRFKSNPMPSRVLEFFASVKPRMPTDALRGVNLSVKSGHIVGLLGPNGAGKSTLLQHILGLYLPSRGECTTFGKPSHLLTGKDLARIGYVEQFPSFPPRMYVFQLLRFIAAHYPTWNKRLGIQLCKKWNLDLGARISELSPGMRQCLALVTAISHEPDLLLLDEPAASLDPIARDELFDLLIETIQDQKHTIVVSSHALSDVERIADHIVMLEKGAVCEDEPLDVLKEKYLKVSVSSIGGELSSDFEPPAALHVELNRYQAYFVVQASKLPEIHLRFHGQNVNIESAPLSLGEIYRARYGSLQHADQLKSSFESTTGI